MGLHQPSADPFWQQSHAVTALFNVTLATERNDLWSAGVIPLRKVESTVHPVKDPKTVFRKYSVTNKRKVTDAMSKDEAEETSSNTKLPAVGESWLALANTPEIWMHVINEVKVYAALEDGWRGSGTKSVSEQIAVDATLLAKNFAKCLPYGSCPMVGSDDDGYIVMTWDEADLVGNLSVLGEGLYAYYVKRGRDVVKNGRAEIDAPIPEDLANALRP